MGMSRKDVYVEVKRRFFMGFAGTFLMVFCCFMF